MFYIPDTPEFVKFRLLIIIRCLFLSRCFEPFILQLLVCNLDLLEFLFFLLLGNFFQISSSFWRSLHLRAWQTGNARKIWENRVFIFSKFHFSDRLLLLFRWLIKSENTRVYFYLLKLQIMLFLLKFILFLLIVLKFLELLRDFQLWSSIRKLIDFTLKLLFGFCDHLILTWDSLFLILLKFEDLFVPDFDGLFGFQFDCFV